MGNDNMILHYKKQLNTMPCKLKPLKEPQPKESKKVENNVS